MNYIVELDKLNDMLEDVLQQVKKLTMCERDLDSYLDIPVLTDNLTEARHMVIDMIFRARSI